MQDQTKARISTFLGIGQALPGRPTPTQGNEHSLPLLDSDSGNEQFNCNYISILPLSQRMGDKQASKNSSANELGARYFGETDHAHIGVVQTDSTNLLGRVQTAPLSSPGTVMELQGMNLGNTTIKTDLGTAHGFSTFNQTAHAAPTDPKNPGTATNGISVVASCSRPVGISIDKADPGTGTGHLGIQSDLTCASLHMNSFYPNFDPEAIRQHGLRIKQFWPSPSPQAWEVFPEFCKLYSDIKTYARPNAIGARIKRTL